jgi:hypothetical protein
MTTPVLIAPDAAEDVARMRRVPAASAHDFQVTLSCWRTVYRLTAAGRPPII